MGGPTGGCSKVSKQARLVERKVCFISDAGQSGGRGRVADICLKANSRLHQAAGESTYRQIL